MKIVNWQKIMPHTISIALFIAIALLFFYPVLEGKQIFQPDIGQYTGMAKERNDFREIRESYWTNSAFGGMPTYQLGAEYPHNYIKNLDKIIRFLPRPADYLFLYFIGMYILLLSLKINYRYAILGAIAFGFSTYLMVIITAGHNAKAHAIGYFAWVMAGLLLIFQKNRWGFLLFSLALALELSANHYQMTYYLLLLIAIFLGVNFYYHIKNNEVTSYFKKILLVVGAGVLALLLNATSLLATQEYAQFSTRSKSELKYAPNGSLKKDRNGLSKEYITEYSYGISESLNLIIPRIFGGGNHEDLGEKSNTYAFLIQDGVPHYQAYEFSQKVPTYWGNQPIVGAPAYIGIVVFYLFLLGVFLVKKPVKWWLLLGSIFSIILSWGKNISFLTDFLIEYFPMYNKFRAVSSIQVVLELCIPVLAIIGLFYLVKEVEIREKNKKIILYITASFLVLFLGLFIFKDILFNFEGLHDSDYANAYGNKLMNAIRQDRIDLYVNDLGRSTIFTILIFVGLFFFLKGKISENILLVFVSVLLLADLLPIAKNYLNADNFVTARQVEYPFEISPIEQEVQKDTSHFRVFSFNEGLGRARTSFFFKSMGGYHAAKPKAIEELFEYHLGNIFPVLSMFNTKYFSLSDENGQMRMEINSEALGNAWFVKNVKKQKTADEEIRSIGKINLKQTAISTDKNLQNKTYLVDSLAQIQLIKYEPDRLWYHSKNAQKGFAVFSEAYYPKGWQVFVNEQQVPMYKVNYALRGIEIPAGDNQIEFRFEPQVVKTGSFISLGAFVIFVSIFGYQIFIFFFRRKKEMV